ncbi:hypothetical protein ElyMa_000837800 [Elysia marginata]|uniref:Uncharacterized protein n=1 Tax=Elysia marginata TaxID=1093978 RepID=A0AAV4H324_9GAST|nr:hypothetical protein ElyMa_000837800 [Elysia marginata]
MEDLHRRDKKRSSRSCAVRRPYKRAAIDVKEQPDLKRIDLVVLVEEKPLTERILMSFIRLSHLRHRFKTAGQTTAEINNIRQNNPISKWTVLRGLKTFGLPHQIDALQHQEQA